jgi:hypothetical protein
MDRVGRIIHGADPGWGRYPRGREEYLPRGFGKDINEPKRKDLYDILERECGPCVEVPLPAASGKQSETSTFYSAEKVYHLVDMLVEGVSERSRFGTTLSRAVNEEGFVNRAMIFGALVKYDKLTKLLKNYSSR